MSPNEVVHLNWFLQYVAPFISGAFGIGVGWGVMRERIKGVDKKHSQSYGELKERVMKNENKLERQVGSPACNSLRAECRTRIEKQLEEIKEDIKENRVIVMKGIEDNHKKTEEMFRFIGRATEVINRLNSNRKEG